MSHYKINCARLDLCTASGFGILGGVPLYDHGDNGAGRRLEWLVPGDPPERLHDSRMRGDVNDCGMEM